MALSTPPPPPDASPPPTTTTAASTTTTTTATTTHAARPPFPPNPRLPPPPHSLPVYPTTPFYPPQMIHPHPSQLLNSRLPSNPNFPHPQQTHDVSTTASTPGTTNAAMLYPVSSSGRGFLQKPPPCAALSNSNPNSYPFSNRTGVLSYARPLFGYPHPDPGQGPGIGMGLGYVSGRPTHLQQSGGGTGAVVLPGVINSVPVASSLGQRKITLASNSIADCNGHRDTRDDSFVTIRDRKVRVSENASVYALCQSWLKNGSFEESQPVYMDGVRSLPRPLPLSAQDNSSPVKKDDDKEEEEEEGYMENLTPEELLQTHIKRAKRVRSRLREERLRRIARYKTRLALLLPPIVEQQLRNDSASGN